MILGEASGKDLDDHQRSSSSIVPPFPTSFYLDQQSLSGVKSKRKKAGKERKTKSYHRNLTGESFDCNQCDKSFRFSCQLVQHMLVHTKERPFACDQCSKTYPYKSALKKHKLSHSEERKFPCKVCDKSFAHSEGLKSHLKSH